MISLKVDQSKNEFFEAPNGKFLIRLSIFDFPQRINITTHKIKVDYIDEEDIVKTINKNDYKVGLDAHGNIRELILLSGLLEDFIPDFDDIKKNKQVEAIVSTYLESRGD